MFSRFVFVNGLVFVMMVFSSGLRAAEGTIRIVSLAEVTDLALKNSFDIQIAKYDILTARQGTEAAEAVYDTMLRAGASYSDDRMERNSSLLAERVRERTYSAGISRTFPSGTTFSLDQVYGRDRTSNGGVFYNPVHEAVSRLTVEQDLGRNFFGTSDRGRVKIAIKDVQNAEFLSFYKMEQQLASVQKAYWNLVFLYEADRIYQEMLEQAERLYETDQNRFEHGLVETPQLLGSEANYQERMADAALSKSALLSGMNVLKLQLNIADPQCVLMPEDAFSMQEHTVSLQDSMKRAFENRTDYQQALNEAARQNMVLEVARYNAWPEIQLKASFARNGLGNDFDDAVSRLSRENRREFFTELTFSMPLENRSAKSAFRQAEYQKARALLNAKYTERKIAIEIADQIIACEAAQERLQYLKQAAELQTRRADEQEKIFRQGRSDSDTVIRYQNDALSARMQFARAFYEYYTSLIELKRREGVLLADAWDGEI